MSHYRTPLAIWMFAAVLVAGALPATAQFSAQQSGAGQPYPPGPVSHLPGDLGAHEPDPLHDKMEAARAKSMRDDRYKHLEADADRLLALATELKSEVDKSGKDELSVVVVKKAGEMEKLAHDLKERMRN